MIYKSCCILLLNFSINLFCPSNCAKCICILMIATLLLNKNSYNALTGFICLLPLALLEFERLRISMSDWIAIPELKISRFEFWHWLKILSLIFTFDIFSNFIRSGFVCWFDKVLSLNIDPIRYVEGENHGFNPLVLFFGWTYFRFAILMNISNVK